MPELNLNRDIFQENNYVAYDARLFRVIGLEVKTKPSRTYIRLEDAHGEWDNQLRIYTHHEVRMLAQRADSHLIRIVPDAESERHFKVRRPTKATA